MHPSQKSNVDELGVREEEMADQTEDTGSVPPKEVTQSAFLNSFPYVSPKLILTPCSAF